jgi:hypothetical protein
MDKRNGPDDSQRRPYDLSSLVERPTKREGAGGIREPRHGTAYDLSRRDEPARDELKPSRG